MRKKVYVVELSDDERPELAALIHAGTTRARMVNRAQIGVGEARTKLARLYPLITPVAED